MDFNGRIRGPLRLSSDCEMLSEGLLECPLRAFPRQPMEKVTPQVAVTGAHADVIEFSALSVIDFTRLKTRPTIVT